MLHLPLVFHVEQMDVRVWRLLPCPKWQETERVEPGLLGKNRNCLKKSERFIVSKKARKLCSFRAFL